MNNESIAFGAGGAILGLLIGFLAGGPDVDELEDRLTERIRTGTAETAAAVTEKTGALEKRIAALEEALASGAETQAANAADMSARIEGAVSALSERIDAAAESASSGAARTSTEVTTALSGQLDALSGRLDWVARTVGTMTAGNPAPSGVAAAPAGPPEIQGARVGETESLLDGQVRVFVSAVDAAAGTARVAINGLSMTEISRRRPVRFATGAGECTLSLDAIVEGHAQMSAECDG